MHTAQHVAPADHLQVRHHRIVAHLRGLPGVSPRSERVGSGGENRESMFVGCVRQAVSKLVQLCAGSSHVDVRGRLGFRLQLQELAVDPVPYHPMRSAEQALRYFPRSLHGLSVSEEIFLLDSEAECRGSKLQMAHARAATYGAEATIRHNGCQVGASIRCHGAGTSILTRPLATAWNVLWA